MSQQPQRITVQPIAEGIQACLGPGGLSNSMVVEGRDAVLVVDTQLTPSLGRQVSEVAAASGKPVRYVIITHGDSDHVFGTQEFVPGSVVISHRLTRERILREGDKPKENAIRQRPQLQAELESVRIVVPPVAFESSLEIDLGNLVVQCIYVGPAHTPGDVAVWIPERGVLHSADAVSNGIFPVMRNADMDGWLRALDRLEKLNAKSVVPGHGAVGDGSIVTAQRELLVALRDEIVAARSRGLSEEQALKEIRLPRYESLAMASARLPEAIKRLYSNPS